MRSALKLKLIAGALTLVPAAVLGATAAEAQSSNTFIASFGNDASVSCTRTSPCQTFSSAQGKTTIGGVITCVDPLSLGQLSISKSLTVDCQAGGGSNAFSLIVDAPGASVRVRNFTFNATGLYAAVVDIRNAANLHLEHVVVENSFDKGIWDRRPGPGQLFVTDSIVRNFTGPGIVIAPSSGTIAAIFDNVHIETNGYGIAAGNGARVMIKRSVLSGNTSAGVAADPGSFIGINDTLISNNGTGIFGNGQVAISNSDINSNGTAFNGATVSYGNNRVFANPSLGTTPTPIGNASSEFGQQ